MSSIEVRIPDIGDAEDVEVIELCVQPGDRVNVDDPLIVIESDKASMEVPAPASGVVESFNVDVNDIVNTGDLIVTLTAEQATAAPPTEPLVADGGGLAQSTADQSVESPAAETQQPTSVPHADVHVVVPDIGDAKDVIVIEILARSGEEVKLGDPLVVIESDKASMEIPSPVEGVIAKVHVQLDDEVNEGSPIVDISPAAVQREARGPASSPQREIAAERREPETVTVTGDAEPEPHPEPNRGTSSSVYAGPAVRRMARELGVDLVRVNGSGARGRIVKEDVQSFVKTAMSSTVETVSAAALPELPDFSVYGEVEVAPLSRIRTAGAKNLSSSWAHVVHVTQHDEADVTDLEQFRSDMNADAKDRSDRLSPLPFILKATASTLQEFPTFNASIHPTLDKLTLKRYYHLGMAVDTPDGLVVPVIRDVDKKNVRALAHETRELAELAVAKRLKPAQLQGASFTISSLGAIGGTGFTPIINPPEVAILGVANLATRPQWTGSEFVPRQVLPLSLSYDHRANDGADAGRFVQALKARLQDIRRLLI